MHPVFARILHDREPGERFTERGTCIESSAGTAYYAKLGGAREHEQWAGEAAALRAMRAAAPGLAPEPFAFGAADADGNDVAPDAPSARTYFLSAYSDHGGLTDAAARTLGRRLAGEMHRYESPEGRFGFGVPTYCGATRFENGWHETWAGCFDAMVGQMLGYLRERGKFASLQRKGALLRERCVRVVDA
jgi:protein-ribulosamine 3-kinase